MNKAYPVITLCGSTRFRKEYEMKQKELTLQGKFDSRIITIFHS